eukprot:COSAG04_NODE_1218_length_7708_cov_1.979629_3_plen_166_part_00
MGEEGVAGCALFELMSDELLVKIATSCVSPQRTWRLEDNSSPPVFEPSDTGAAAGLPPLGGDAEPSGIQVLGRLTCTAKRCATGFGSAGLGLVEVSSLEPLVREPSGVTATTETAPFVQEAAKVLVLLRPLAMQKQCPRHATADRPEPWLRVPCNLVDQELQCFR